MRGHKQYFVEYESDKKVCGTYNHHAGNASTIRSAKTIIYNIRKYHSKENPRNFRIYDCFAEVDEKTNFVPCVYSEQ